MNRRTFAQLLAATAAVPLAPAARAETSAPAATPFPLSVMLWTIEPNLPFAERLEKVAAAGYTNIELVGEYAHWTAADFDRANAARKRLGLRFDATAGLPHGIADPSARDAFLADLKSALVPMETLVCPAMIVLSGNFVPGLSHEQQHQSCVEGLRQAVKLVEGQQIDGQPIRLLLECIDPEENPKYFLQSAAEGIDIVREVNHPQVQFLYDIFHEQIAEGNLIEKLDKHIDIIGLVHIADVPGRHEPGTGEINWPNIYRKLAALNYRHIAAMEFRPTTDAVASLRAARELVAHSASA
ncbi:MAG TPA: TIM barrel protein [Terracidiphilus sp.]|jgi:hydroxypyruvate isomerase|nr:TIM barrel protein [Terracidiphilus sp.]